MAKPAARKTVWKAFRSQARGVVGYLETFTTPFGEAVSIPGVSRWIDGPVLDVSKARKIED